MTRLRHAAAVLTSALLGTVVVGACTAGSVGAAPTVTSPARSSVAAPDSGGKRLPVTLPADWPTTVPVPPGTLTATSGVSPRWSLLLVVNGSAAQVQRSSIAFYTSRGWAKEGLNGVHKGHLHIGLGATNRDHSATSSSLTVVLARM